MSTEKITRKRLFYDIETSFCQGHFWRPGWNQNILPHQIISYAKIISIHYKWEGEDKVHNLDWGLKKQCDKKMLEKFIPIMDQADEIITHNGKRFDTPWIRTRAMFHGIPMRFSYNELDTYKMAKKYLNLPSNALKEVAKYYGLTPKEDAGGIETWKGVIFGKDKEAMKQMLFYGDGDVHTLEEIFNLFRPYAQPNLHYAVLRGGEKHHCPNCGSMANHRHRKTTAAGTVLHYMKCKDVECRTIFKINNKTYQDWLEYKMVHGKK